MIRRITTAFVVAIICFVTISCGHTNQNRDDVYEITEHNSPTASTPTASTPTASTPTASTPKASDDSSNYIEINSDTKNDSNMNLYLGAKEFWINNRSTLEKVAKEMVLSGIDYIADGKGYTINNGNLNEIDLTNVESITSLLEQSEGLLDQIGWSLPGDPLFSNGKQYFYCDTPIYTVHGKEISYTLVFSENATEDIYPYTIFEVLSPNWILVTNYYGE